ncbi:methyltransferase [Candidatus Woesearchaeota archaeon]|nr:methyltransferase [Candidatus Woesearchaeota archaeon]
MHTGLVIVNKGAEDIAALELKELIKASAIKKYETAVKFNFKEFLELCAVCYRAQSVARAILLLAEFDVDKSMAKTVKNIEKIFPEKDIKKWIHGKKSFMVETRREGEHDFKSVDISKNISLKIAKYKSTPEYDNPEIIFYVYIYQDKGYFGIDFSGMDLSKRQYKIFNHPESLKGTTGYVLVRESGFKREKVLIDPFMGSGVIVIEAALFSQKFPVRFYDKDKLFFTRLDFFKDCPDFFEKKDAETVKDETDIYGYDAQLKYLKASQKNSKLAGVDRFLNMSKVDIEWLDTKFEKNSVNFVVSDPPRMSKQKDSRELLKRYNELFYQANYILKKTGCLVLLARDSCLLEEAAKNHKFKIKKNYTLNQGKDIFNVLIFIRE